MVATAAGVEIAAAAWAALGVGQVRLDAEALPAATALQGGIVGIRRPGAGHMVGGLVMAVSATPEGRTAGKT